MARILRKRRSPAAIAIIVDGKDEKWYIEKVRQHYPCDKIRKIKIEPNLPSAKKINELFSLAKEKIEAHYNRVILFIDLDEPLKDNNEFNTFKDWYGKYLQAIAGKLPPRSRHSWLDKVLIVINNPCLEYWYLLHFRKTNKFYDAFEPELKADLRKIACMENYEKSESFYNQSPDIYHRLGAEEGIATARKNSSPFDLTTCRSNGCSEMHHLFDFLDRDLPAL